jgi:hypothetical protein
MALPAMHILKDGVPLLPSGMFYARGIGQLYMMAASVMTFGETEWAMRIPSVICGLALIVLAYWYGRRFLAPIWNMAFVASVAFCPGTIADSQEARMYIFLLASLAAYSILIFEWERTNRLNRLAGAVVILLVGMLFHTLAVFGAFLLFYPGLVRGERRLFFLGAAAFLAAVMGYGLISHWVSGFYPPRPAIFGLDKLVAARSWGITNLPVPVMALAVGVIAAGMISWVAVQRMDSTRQAIFAGLMLFGGLLCQLMLFYHVAGVLLAVGAVMVCRRSVGHKAGLVALLLLSAVLFAVHVELLHLSHAEPLYKILGLMAGLPSVWAYFNWMTFSPMAGVILVIGALQGLWLIASGRKIPDYWLFLVLGAWLPLFLIGFFSWYPDARYTEFALLPLLAGAFAVVGRWKAIAVFPGQVLAAGVVCILIVNPIAVAHAVNSGYSIHPDHKGAAEFIKSAHVGPKDILLAEDVIEQTYYLGRVDYWLIGPGVASEFTQEKNGRIVDIYTGTPVIVTGDELRALIEKPGRGVIYIIGSGEDQLDGRRFVRGPSLSSVLESHELKTVYVGRDGLTKVWRIEPRDMNTPIPAGH